MPRTVSKFQPNSVVLRYRQYGLWERYTELYPQNDLVYNVGESNYSEDWFFAQVRTQTAIVDMVPETLEMLRQNDDLKGVKWETFAEKAGVWSKAPDFIENGFVDHLNTTKDSTEYLWYTTSLYVDETEKFLKSGSKPILMVESKGHAVHTCINQELQVSASGNGSQISYKFEAPISLKAGKNEIAFFSMTVGLSNAGPFYKWVGAGLTSVKISGLIKIGTSGSAGEYGSHSGGESGSNGSFNSRDNGNESQDAAHKRTLDEAFPEGEAADPSKDAQNNGISAESYYSGRRQRTVSKLPVSAPGRATLPVAQSNLNMTMNTWSGQHMPRDEKELKRERRKQSNRESARRSRMRKQQECDDLAKKVNELSSENIALKSEVEQLTKLCKDLEAENVLLMEDVKRVAMTS